jgi:hypothetical protein
MIIIKYFFSQRARKQKTYSRQHSKEENHPPGVFSHAQCKPELISHEDACALLKKMFIWSREITPPLTEKSGEKQSFRLVPRKTRNRVVRKGIQSRNWNYWVLNLNWSYLDNSNQSDTIIHMIPPHLLKISRVFFWKKKSAKFFSNPGTVPDTAAGPGAREKENRGGEIIAAAARIVAAAKLAEDKKMTADAAMLVRPRSGLS